MTHQELVKEFREICEYLHEKAEIVKARYGEKPEIASEQDEWHYEILMQVCKTVEERDGVRPQITVSIPDMQYGHGVYGIGI